MAKYRGLRRLRGLGGAANEVAITDDDMVHNVSETEYRRGLFKPALADLPWDDGGNANGPPSPSPPPKPSNRLTLKCKACGRSVVLTDVPNDEDEIACEGCGRVFGRFAAIREAVVAEAQSRAANAIKEADLPPWIFRKES